MTHFFVLFPQASEPSMNLNISKMVYLLQLADNHGTGGGGGGGGR